MFNFLSPMLQLTTLLLKALVAINFRTFVRETSMKLLELPLSLVTKHAKYIRIFLDSM
jgi:hypothetical protein